MTKWELLRLISGWLAPSRWQEPLPAPASPPQWEGIIEASSNKLVTPLLAWRLREAGWVERDAAAYLSAVLELNRRRNHLLVDGLALALDALAAAGIEPLLLKGADMLATGLYPEPGCRFVGDLDLLFREDQLEEASRTLAGAGFLPTGPALPSVTHQLRPHVHETLQVGLDLHRYPLREHLQPLLDTRSAFAAAEAITVRGRRALRLEATHRAITSIAHGQIVDGLGRVGIPELRRLIDLAVLGERDAIDWPALQRRFAAAGHAGLLADVLRMADHLLGFAPAGLRLGSDEGLRRAERTINRTLLPRIAASLRATLPLAPRLLRKRPREIIRTLGWRAWQQRLQWFSPRW